ncbi:TerC family protein [Paludibacterium yongneupense]|uniref:TerC family protein n=1 Tax=Paludibacterium yongneupense TaxID=400061 RepID=UPI0004057AD6|nr:TerC family protein [Paludibacterium yongneupense]
MTQTAMPHIGTPLFYTVFFVVVLAMIFVDMLSLKRQGAHEVSAREALGWTLIWIVAASVFGAGLWWSLAAHFGTAVATARTTEYFTGYVLEKSLAIDNIFVFLLIFKHFSIPPQYQRRVLLYGVFGAIVLRVLMIMLGAALVARFSWILYLFGVFLVYTGVRMLLPGAEHESDPGQNPVLRFVRRHIPLSDSLDGERFLTLRNGARCATPLLLVLIMIELSDVIFAVDSIPAVFAVTLDPFIVLTSNIFAILGLRAMYFLLAGIANRIHHLDTGLALVLVFIGSEMLLADIWHVPTLWSLGVIFLLVGGAVAASLLFPRK